MYSYKHGYTSEMSSDSRESLDHRDPPCFLSLDTSLDIKTVILKVLIPVSISRLNISESQFQSRYQRLKFQKSQFQSRYQDSTIKSLEFSLDVQT